MWLRIEDLYSYFAKALIYKCNNWWHIIIDMRYAVKQLVSHTLGNVWSL